MIPAGKLSHVTVIAEVGVNHNGDRAIALKLIDDAAQAGADIVKFQSFRADEVISRHASKADYQKETTGSGESQVDMVRKYELSEQDHRELLKRCAERRVEFLSTPFDLPSLDLLITLGVRRLKIPSGEITNAPLLVAAAQTRRPIILSTGMSTLGDIEQALGMLAFGYLDWKNKPGEATFQEAFNHPDGQNALREKVTLLHCTTEYPAPFEDVHLRCLETLQRGFGLPVGFSDHTPGIAIPLAAVALGAVMIEKHVTFDCSAAGPDHRASLEIPELARMIEGIRHIEAALGDSRKRPVPSEMKNRDIARKGLVARRQIKPGECFSPENLTAKRPRVGLEPVHYWELLGKPAKREYQVDDPILDE